MHKTPTRLLQHSRVFGRRILSVLDVWNLEEASSSHALSFTILFLWNAVLRSPLTVHISTVIQMSRSTKSMQRLAVNIQLINTTVLEANLPFLGYPEAHLQLINTV